MHEWPDDCPPSPCDPFWDCIDGACPAWWRGSDHAYWKSVGFLRASLGDSTPEDESQSIHDVRRRVEALVAAARDALGEMACECPASVVSLKLGGTALRNVCKGRCALARLEAALK